MTDPVPAVPYLPLREISREIEANQRAYQGLLDERDAMILDLVETNAITQHEAAWATDLSKVRIRQIIKAQRERRAEDTPKEQQ